jgi:formate hydrogenlyase transcriptional activator
LAEAEREHLLQALRDTEWVIGGPHGAAAQLAVRRTTLLYKMRRLGISPARDRRITVSGVTPDGFFPRARGRTIACKSH